MAGRSAKDAWRRLTQCLETSRVGPAAQLRNMQWRLRTDGEPRILGLSFAAETDRTRLDQLHRDPGDEPKPTGGGCENCREIDSTHEVTFRAQQTRIP
jgi:hypothetical protein